MEFALPLRDLHLPRLVQIFQRDPRNAPAWWVQFQEKLASLPVTRLKGYLRGFIDLVFEHQGRFYLIDWKSNYLGGRKSDFQPGKLPQAMVRDLYILQYYLYTAALWLYLEQRVEDFDYDTHFGGVYYIFLRGLESANPANGVFFDRPPRQRVAELVDLLVHQQGSSGS
jgi:exodeoxyribonuclease V beta subunit